MTRIDLGCGPNKREGFVGCDQFAFDGKVDHVFNIGEERWPFDDSSVDEAHASHFVEHLTQPQRIHFCNELYRVLKPDAGCAVIVPHWGSGRAYGDLTHQWPPVCEMWFMYLNREWRMGSPEKGIMANAPHCDKSVWDGGYDCNFEVTYGYSLHPDIALKNQEAQMFALSHYREAAQDIHATFVKK